MLLLIVLFARGGIDGLLARPRARMADALLRIEGLTKRFGGVVASDDVRLDVTRGELHAIIGPNGAGKTTLIGQLAGEIVPDAGRIHFGGQDITRAAGSRPQPARAGAHVPDHVAVSAFHRAGERRAGGPGPRRAFVPVLAAARERNPSCASRPAPRSNAVGPESSREHLACQP